MSILSQKIFSDANTEAVSMLQNWKKEGKKIVFTNGCFDLLHIGHVLYLQEAKALGDILVVGLNTDASVARLKGAHRPIKDQYNRSHILAALSSVDMVILFDEETPILLVEKTLPDVLVKGGDWSAAQIVGSDIVIANGGSVRSLQFVEGYSTTLLEQKIKNSPI